MTSPQTEPQHNYFLVIPSFITDDPKIDDSTAILYGRIVALSNQKGYCWASDKYLAELTRVSEREVRNRIKCLEENGYIIRQTTKNGFNWSRKIYPVIQKTYTKGPDVPFDKDQACHSQGNTSAEDIDKHNNISENYNCSSSSFSEDIKKKETLLYVGLNQFTFDRCLAFSLEKILIAIECLKEGQYGDKNAFFWSALSEGWQPKKKKETPDVEKEKIKEDQEIKKFNDLKEKIQNIIKQAYGNMQEGYRFEIIDGKIHAIREGKEDYIVNVTEGDLQWMEVFYQRFKK